MSVGDFDRKTVLINSQFRESGTSSQFTWRFQERVENVRHAELRYFVLENGVYNVNSYNDTFWLYEGDNLSGGWTYQSKVVIPTGQYDDLTFAATVGLCMSATSYGGSGLGQLYFVQINTTGNMVISTSSSGQAFGIGFYAQLPSGPLEEYPLTAEIMGFDGTTITTVNVPSITTFQSALYLTIVSPDPTYLANFDYLLIQSQKLGNDISFYGAPVGLTLSGGDDPLRGSATSCFAFIPNITPTNNISSLIFNNQRPPQISTLKYPYSLDYIDISVVDKYGANINTNGNNISLVIELYCDKQSQNVDSHFGAMSLRR
jgi:hypothetical protein